MNEDLVIGKGEAEKHVFSFSQPAGAADEYFLGSQLVGSTQGNSTAPMQRWVKRMTRFFVTVSIDDTIKELVQVLDQWGFSWKVLSKPTMSVSTHRIALTFT